MSGSYDKEAVQRFCKDGEQIEMVEISGDYRGLEEKVAVIDTPGIDSTDHAHFLSAASILHQADALLCRSLQPCSFGGKHSFHSLH